MLNRMALLSVAALAAAALPHAASAADYYDEGRGPAVYDGRGDAAFDHGWQDSRRDLRPRFRPGPVAFDERGEERFARGEPEFDEGGPVLPRGPVYGEGPRFWGPGAFGPPPRPVPVYRPVAAPVYGDAFDPRAGRPDVGCTVQEAQSVTPAGWRKTVTYRTCYRR